MFEDKEGSLYLFFCYWYMVMFWVGLIYIRIVWESEIYSFYICRILIRVKSGWNGFVRVDE